MRNLILTAVIALGAMFVGVQSAEAGCCKEKCGPAICLKKKVCKEEVCRRYYCKTKCVFGCPKKVKYVDITYRTTYVDCCGRCSYKTTVKTKRVRC